MIGADVTKVCLQVLNDHRSVSDLNYTFIVLILKVKVPRKVSEFRQISLCNVIYKIITKTLDNQLKKELADIVSEEQSAFVPGQLITDNIIVAYKTMHTIRRKTGGKDGLMALKLDMSKAYDRVEWSFLREVMIKLGFSQRWVERVMDCVSTSQFSFLVDAVPRGKVIPFRGIHQGCPLSPCLLLQCAEGFSGLLRKTVANGRLVGVSCARRAPKVSHLFFADDSILFYKADIPSCDVIKEILKKYEKASGHQVINLQKSIVSFSPNLGMEGRQSILDSLGLPDGFTHDV